MALDITSLYISTIALFQSFGYFGIFVLMTIESSIIPLPAELILIPAGAVVAEGGFNMFYVLIAATIGSIAGALFNYYLALHIGRRATNVLIRKYGRLFFMDEASLIKSEQFFNKHGSITTFVGRLLPGFRSFVSLPAGFARMNLFSFCFFTGLGASIWNLMLLLLGYFFGSNIEKITPYINEISIAVVLVVALGGIFYAWRRYSRAIRSRV